MTDSINRKIKRLDKVLKELKEEGFFLVNIGNTDETLYLIDSTKLNPSEYSDDREASVWSFN